MLTLEFQVISGQQLPRPRGSVAKATVVDPYVLIQIYGFPIDCAGTEPSPLEAQ